MASLDAVKYKLETKTKHIILVRLLDKAVTDTKNHHLIYGLKGIQYFFHLIKKARKNALVKLIIKAAIV